MAETDGDNIEAAGREDSPPQGHFAIHKIYVKDLSFETPNSPRFSRRNGSPR